MAQKHNPEYTDAPMTRYGALKGPEEDKRVVRTSAFVADKWTADNPILQLGELGYETDTNKLKIGDGVTAWNDLAYAGGSSDTSASLAQFDTMPTASADNLGDIVQYVGETDANYTNGYIYQCTGAGEPVVYSWTQIDVQPAPVIPDPLPDQTGQSGKFLTTDGTDASWSDKPLVNTTTKTGCLGILGSVSSSGNSNTVVGSNSSAGGNGTSGMTAIGNYATATANRAIAIGNDATSNGQGSIAIGRCSVASNNTIALNATEGAGLTQLNDPNTMYVAIKNGVWTKLLSSDETVPTARLTKVNSTITLTAAGWSSNTQTVSVTGMTATGVVLVSPDPTDQADYTSAGIYCSAQAAGTLTFTCSTTPTNDIDVVVVML